MENKSHKKRSLYRIEDFISLYKKGENISLNVNLRIEKILRQDNQYSGSNNHIDGYLFIGDFIFSLNSKLHTISKVYSLSYLTNEPNDLHVDRKIANARLKMDYGRLQQGGFHIREKYFRENDCS